MLGKTLAKQWIKPATSCSQVLYTTTSATHARQTVFGMGGIWTNIASLYDILKLTLHIDGLVQHHPKCVYKV